MRFWREKFELLDRRENGIWTFKIVESTFQHSDWSQPHSNGHAPTGQLRSDWTTITNSFDQRHAQHCYVTKSSVGDAPYWRLHNMAPADASDRDSNDQMDQVMAAITDRLYTTEAETKPLQTKSAKKVKRFWTFTSKSHPIIPKQDLRRGETAVDSQSTPRRRRWILANSAH